MGTVPYLLQGLGLQTPWVVLMLEIKEKYNSVYRQSCWRREGFC